MSFPFFFPFLLLLHFNTHRQRSGSYRRWVDGSKQNYNFRTAKDVSAFRMGWTNRKSSEGHNQHPAGLKVKKEKTWNDVWKRKPISANERSSNRFQVVYRDEHHIFFFVCFCFFLRYFFRLNSFRVSSYTREIPIKKQKTIYVYQVHHVGTKIELVSRPSNLQKRHVISTAD